MSTPQSELSFETISGDESLIDDLELTGKVEFLGQSSSNDLYMNARLRMFYPTLRDESNYFTYDQGRTTFTSDLSFFDQLNSITFNPLLNKVRLNHPGFMRNKGINSVRLAETEEEFITGNFKGDYDLINGYNSSEVVLGFLNKETNEEEHFSYTMDFNGYPLDTYLEALYHHGDSVHLLIRSLLNEGDDYTFHLVEFDRSNNQFSQQYVATGNFSVLSSQTNSAFVLFEESEVDPDYGEVLSTDFYALNLETGEQIALSSFENNEVIQYPEFVDESIYRLDFDSSNSRIHLEQFSISDKTWHDLSSMEIVIPTETIENIPWEISNPDTLDHLSTQIMEDRMITYSYIGTSETPIHIQINQLDNGELLYHGTIGAEQSHQHYELQLSSIRQNP
jgi:hypothetical protein